MITVFYQEFQGWLELAHTFLHLGDVFRLVCLVESLVRGPVKTFESFAGKLAGYALAEHSVSARVYEPPH